MRRITIVDRRRRPQLPLMVYYCPLFRERYYHKVMGSDYLLFYDRFILVTYEYCDMFYDYISIIKKINFYYHKNKFVRKKSTNKFFK